MTPGVKSEGKKNEKQFVRGSAPGERKTQGRKSERPGPCPGGEKKQKERRMENSSSRALPLGGRKIKCKTFSRKKTRKNISTGALPRGGRKTEGKKSETQFVKGRRKTEGKKNGKQFVRGSASGGEKQKGRRVKKQFVRGCARGEEE